MSSGRAAFGLITDDAPRLNSTAVSYGRMLTSLGGTVPQPEGRFTLRRDGVTVVDDQVMGPSAEMGEGYLRYVVPANLMTRGNYTWEQMFTDPMTGFQAAKQGRFTIR